MVTTENAILVGRMYKHFKGNVYKVLAIARHSETEEAMVVYSSIKEDSVWVRPLKMWNDVIDDVGTIRFTLIE